MLAPSTKLTINSTTKLIPLQVNRIRILLVAESPEGQRKLQAATGNSEYEITCAGSFEELIRALNQRYDIIALDVTPAHLTPMLKMIRLREQNAGILVLLDGSEINNHLNLAGVLPFYRAMPCNRVEMMKLLNGRSEAPRGASNHYGML